MIQNQWYIVADSREVRKGRPVGLKRMGEELVFWRDENGKVICLRDRCIHRGAALSIGKLVNHHLQCPFHGLEFNEDGKCVYIPASGTNGIIPKVFQLQSFPVKEQFGWIWLWWGIKKEQELPGIQWFESIDDSFEYDTFFDPWPTHYSRVIENQLDVVHLPFVHRNTIGRGNRRVVDGPLALWDENDENLLNVWVFNRQDNGQPPMKPSELTIPHRHPQLQFHIPNYWQNWIADDIRIMAAFVPVDENHTLLYLRFYQKMVRMPVIKEVFHLMGRLGNYIIERQDRHVVITQKPLRSYHRMGESLLQGDHPIILYRKRREDLSQPDNGLS